MVFCQQFGANSSYIVGGYFLFALGPFGYTCGDTFGDIFGLAIGCLEAAAGGNQALL